MVTSCPVQTSWEHWASKHRRYQLPLLQTNTIENIRNDMSCQYFWVQLSVKKCLFWKSHLHENKCFNIKMMLEILLFVFLLGSDSSKWITKVYGRTYTRINAIETPRSSTDSFGWWDMSVQYVRVCPTCNSSSLSFRLKWTLESVIFKLTFCDS